MRNHLKPDMSMTFKTIVTASITVFNKILETLKPTPEKSYYFFNLRDLARVIFGI